MKNKLEFIVTNDPENDFELMQEVWLNDQEIADLRLIDDEWQVTFFPCKDSFFEIPLDTFEKIYKAFDDFVSSQAKGKEKV